jgi:hypothetical protein
VILTLASLIISWQSSLVATAMTTTIPTPDPSAITKPITFAVGTVVRAQHNTNLFKIHSHAAWSDDDHQTPTFYNLTGPSGQLHRMVPVERLILRANTMGAAAYADREILALDAPLGEIVPRVKHTHCWKCTTTLSHLNNEVCPTCGGLQCECGGCRCNWPYPPQTAYSRNVVTHPVHLTSLHLPR